jgi:2-oxoglutarate ferredoxin oxidoreductase subunit beta
MTAVSPPVELTAKDFATDQEIRWCPGCGDYAIVKAVRNALAQLNVSKENTVFVSGIGCAARLPYYMATYGFHTIHGRAPAIATGIKLANPELDVWIATGDGDSLSIGGNHLLHILRRNVNVQILLFNNEIYGLTKGQYSPTSRLGTQSPSTPLGSVERPVSAAALALGAGAQFVARSVDTLQAHLPKILIRAHDHRGASFVEIFQNCIVYNDGVFSDFTSKDVAADQQLHLEHGKPMIFGAEGNKGIRVNAERLEFEVLEIGSDGITEKDLLVHDETNRALATMLAAMEPPAFPTALGVLFCRPEPTYEGAVGEQIETAKSGSQQHDLNKVLRHGYTWSVDSEHHIDTQVT